MSDPVTAAGPVDPADLSASDASPRRPHDAKGATAIVPAGAARTHARNLPPESHTATDSIFAAQVMGQTGRKRGLKGGPPVLYEAKAAYLGTEWSGPSDRRLAVGKMTKTDI